MPGPGRGPPRAPRVPQPWVRTAGPPGRAAGRRAAAALTTRRRRDECVPVAGPWSAHGPARFPNPALQPGPWWLRALKRLARGVHS